MKWEGVFPAITTPFHFDLSIDTEALRQHVRWLVAEGCRGIVPLGSLGEGASLEYEEKLEVLRNCREALDGSVPLVLGVGATSTREAVRIARAAASIGANALMVLPPYVYRGDARETEAHLKAVLEATHLPCLLYNNPIAYGVDVEPAQVERLARDHPNLEAVKESSGSAARMAEIERRLGGRVQVMVGMDDQVLDGVQAGAVGWIAGLVNALPRESVRLFELARGGPRAEAEAFHEWFLPFLKLDTVPKFVQLIKLVQELVGRGSARVRPPRLELEGAEWSETCALVRAQLAKRPSS